MTLESNRGDRINRYLFNNYHNLESSLTDSLKLFTAMPHWPTSSLEDLMTMALLESKVEFVRLFVMNGLVTSEYLTVYNLRKLYNDSVS